MTPNNSEVDRGVLADQDLACQPMCIVSPWPRSAPRAAQIPAGVRVRTNARPIHVNVSPTTLWSYSCEPVQSASAPQIGVATDHADIALSHLPRRAKAATNPTPRESASAAPYGMANTASGPAPSSNAASADDSPTFQPTTAAAITRGTPATIARVSSLDDRNARGRRTGRGSSTGVARCRFGRGDSAMCTLSAPSRAPSKSRATATEHRVHACVAGRESSGRRRWTGYGVWLTGSRT